MYVTLVPFRPLGASTAITVTASSATTALPKTSPNGTGSVRIVNVGANTVFFTLGPTSSISTTTTTGIALLPNTERIFQLHQTDLYIAMIAGATGNTAYVSCGEGA